MPGQLYFVALIASLLFHVAALAAQPTSEPSLQPNEIRLFSTPDESSLLVGLIKGGDPLTPMAEILGAGGTKWYMVQTKSGSVGWIKADGTDESKKFEGLFKSSSNSTAIFTPTEIGSPPSDASSQRAITVPVNIVGSKVIVPVTFNGIATGNLALDTGADRTTISYRIAGHLRLYSAGVGTAAGATGAPTRVSVVRMESVRVGAAEVHNLLVIIHDLPFGLPVEGLLGLDFLDNFHMALDTRKRLLVLTPR